jgi:hypothetical protein
MVNKELKVGSYVLQRKIVCRIIKIEIRQKKGITFHLGRRIRVENVNNHCRFWIYETFLKSSDMLDILYE